MKNILSYKRGTIFTGKVIKDWTEANLNCSDKKKRKYASYLRNHYQLKDNKRYAFYSTQSSLFRKISTPLLLRID